MDGCYSFWQGGIFPLLHDLLEPEAIAEHSWLFDHSALQEYLLICCQDPRGGLVDKPGKSRDFYHTCYTLSGLAVSQNLPSPSLLSDIKAKDSNRSTAVLGDATNRLVATHPLFNISYEAVEEARRYYGSLPACLLPTTNK